MSDQLFTGKFSDAIGDQPVAERKYGTRVFVYLAAIGAATLGWSCLIGWTAMRIIGLL
jgi:hypothetical protein